MSNLRSAKLRAARRPINWAQIGGGIVGLLISAVIWIIGARYTVDGIIWLANMLLAFLHITARIPTPLAWQLYLVLAPIPFLFSVVEWRNLPFERTSDGLAWNTPGMIAVWLIVYAIDGITTYTGVRNPDPDSLLIARQVAASGAISATVAAILTVGPEWLLRSMVWVIKRALKP
jgi:hypothetical protein